MINETFKMHISSLMKTAETLIITTVLNQRLSVSHTVKKKIQRSLCAASAHNLGCAHFLHIKMTSQASTFQSRI